MRTILSIVFSLIILPLFLSAQSLEIKTCAKQGLTGEAMGAMKAYLLPVGGNDTIHAKTSFKGLIDANGDMVRVKNVTFSVPGKAATYILTAEADGYEDIVRTIVIDRVGKREFEKEIPDLLFYRKSKTLDEVTVSATKVKFYVKGDTLVYNADAFQLAQGSMLDVLVRQLPGVELRDNGQIYVNGKFVESLLLNGKDFFKGDNNLMLNNLGAYTVKDVAVYDKWGDRSMLAGQNVGDSQFVMDVRLKREYMSGYMGNIEAGAGTSSRYLGRLFGTWYTVKSRLTLIGNINNLNDSRRPGQNDNFSSSNTPGDFRTKMAGIDYNVTEDFLELTGNTTVSHTRNLAHSVTDKVSFLTTGDSYAKNFSDALSRNLSVSTENNLKLRPGKQYIGIGQYINYRRNNVSSQSLSGTFDNETKTLTRELLRRVYSGEATSLGDITVNTSLSQALRYSRSFEAGGNVYVSSKLPHTPDILSLGVSGKYTTGSAHGYDLYDINFNRLDKRSRNYNYSDDRPDRSWDISIAPSYEYLPSSNLSIDFSPRFRHTHSTKDSYFYRLDRLADSGTFGTLPDGYMSAIDEGLSYLSTEKDNELSFEVNMVGEINKKGRWNYQIWPVFTYRWRGLDYRQSARTQNVSHNGANIEFRNTHLAYRVGQDNIQLTYNRTVRPVSLVRLVDVTDSRDPLNIYEGATSLKDAVNNDWELRWERKKMGRHRWNNMLSAKINIVENALVNSYDFNEDTGVRKYVVRNVGGNWKSGLFDSFVKTFGTRDQFDISALSRINYEHAADLTATGSESMTRYTVENLNLSQSVQLNWRVGKHKLGANGRIEWRDTRSDNANFTPFSATVGQYGVTAQLSLPYNFTLSTDFTAYTRRGYYASELNTTDVVWNARLSYSFDKGRWLVMLDGFDLLHQLSSITYNVNAQGRTEVWRNTLPRYGLLHIQYRFAIQPKQK